MYVGLTPWAFTSERVLRMYVLDADNNTREHRRWLARGTTKVNCSKEAIDVRGQAARDELIRRGLKPPTSWEEVR